MVVGLVACVEEVQRCPWRPRREARRSRGSVARTSAFVFGLAVLVGEEGAGARGLTPLPRLSSYLQQHAGEPPMLQLAPARRMEVRPAAAVASASAHTGDVRPAADGAREKTLVAVCPRGPRGCGARGPIAGSGA